MLRKLFVLFWNWVAYLMHTFLLGFYVKINLSDKFYLLRNALSTVVSGCCEAISLLWVNLFKSYFFHTFSFFCGVLHLSTCLNLWVTTFPGVHTAWLATEKMVNFEFNCHRHPHNEQFLDAHRPIKPVWQHGRVSEASESEPFLPQAVTFIGQACSSNNDKCCLTCIGGTDHLNWRLIQGFTLVLWDSNLPTFPCSSEARAQLSWKV